MRAVSGVPGVPGRWVWAVSGVVTAALLTVPGIRLVTHGAPGAQDATAMPGPAVTFTVPQPVKAVDISSDGGPVRITAGPVSRVTVTEPSGPGTSGPAGGPSPVTIPQPAVKNGLLTVSAASSGPGLITVIVPRNTAVTVTADGGPVWVSGLSGPLTVDSGSGPEQIGAPAAPAKPAAPAAPGKG